MSFSFSPQYFAALTKVTFTFFRSHGVDKSSPLRRQCGRHP
jgi:hypothetical protein